MTYIDTHVHFWKPARGDYGWLKPSNELMYRDYLPWQLLPHLQEQGVEGVIAVQAAFTAEETEFLLELAEENPVIMGVVGGLDPLAADFAEKLERLSAHERLVGLRFNGEFFASSAVADPLRRLERTGLTIDVLTGPEQMEAVYAHLRHVPELKAVVNHLGNPLGGSTDLWRQGIERLAELPEVRVKLSGMITQSGAEFNLEARGERLKQYVGDLLRTFGTERLMFGSDWPVALHGGAYKDVIRLFESFITEAVSVQERQAIRSINARAVYGRAKTRAKSS
ncbi:amidohydrolase family protein [Paenibacillus roseipurpureus]|uniref:Amidohydrolase family protein n=1 Tax=Paenibacillus roseopurpureus TaxID=2918901 RepID=A0AA96LKS6_9BACL|nr:amidohydrolase family protein [Paenibacillus sp. MBLB1832]WNR42863.1 amidohydrolase family protein [Paenibacillus sp. MBLB1832]